MEKGKRLAINVSAQVVSFLTSVLVSFFLTSFIVDKIGTEVYGFVGLSNNVISYVTVFTVALNSLANRYITISYVKNDIEGANRYFTSVTAANILVTLIIAIPGIWLILNLENVVNIPSGYEADIKGLWTFVFLMFALGLISGRMEVATFAKNRLDLSGINNMISNILKLVLLVFMYAFFAPRITYVGISAFICAAFVAIMNYRYMKKLTPELKFSRKLIEFAPIKEIVSNGIWNSADQMSQLLFNGLDLLLANLFISAAGMGLLSIAKTIPIQILVFICIIAGVFYPNMTISYAKENKAEFVKETDFAMRLCGLINSVPIVGLMMFGKSFFALWLPSLTNEELNMVQILSVLTVLPQFFSIYIFPLYQVNTLTCKLKVPSILSVGLGVINVITVFLLLKFSDLGLYAIAGVSSILQVLRIVFFVPLYAAANVKVGFKTFYPPLIKGIILNASLMVIFGLIQSFIKTDNLLIFVIVVCISAVIGYVMGVFILFNKSDVHKIIEMIKRKKRAG